MLVISFVVSPLQQPRTFASPAEALSDVVAVLRRAGPLADVYLRGRLKPELREQVMVAVSRVNACRGCTRVHERWGIRAGVSSDELKAIGLGDLATLDDRDRAAIVYATVLAEAHFRGPIPADVASNAADQLTAPELAAVDAVARAMALANLSVNTTEALIERLR